MNISKTKVMRCARDVAPKEAAVDPCDVCRKSVGVNSIQCATCGYWVHGRCTGVRGSLVRVTHGFVCKMCRGEGREAVEKFCFEDVELDCVGEFVYLEDMLNDTGGAEQAVARVRAAWMKFRELGGMLCTRGASLRMKGVVHNACVRSVLMYGAETWVLKVGVFQRL